MTVSHKRPVIRWRKAASLVILGLLAVLLAGCPDDDDGNTALRAVNDTATTEQDTASAPIIVLANDTAADGDTLTITEVTNGANGTTRIAGRAIIYTPAPGFVGRDTFTYTISDGRATDTATVTVTVTSTGFRLTVLHNNDGESQLIDAGGDLENFGGVARFAAVVQRLRDDATAAGSRVVLLSSGDNFLAGPEFNASLSRTGNERVPFFDTIALDRIGYTAFAIGNHEFDFGPEVLIDFIRGFTAPAPFLSANLDFRGEPGLQALVNTGRIAASTVATVDGRRIGIIGATTPRLPFISNPGNVVVNNDVAGAIQAEVDRLTADGVNVLILISHLQSIEEDLALAPQLRNLDIMIAGGGDELLANPDTVLIPGDENPDLRPYPLMATDADGNQLPVITTSGAYRYVGRLIADFDATGRITTIDVTSGPVRVAGGNVPDAVTPDPIIQEQVVEPVQAAINDLDTTIIGTTEVPLNGVREDVRTLESNEGNLIADALLFQATESAADLEAPQPDVALQNGGGIRNDTILPVGQLSELDTFDMLPFANFVAIVPNISAAQFKEILENAVSRVEFTDGRFAQIAGFRFIWDPNGTPQILDAEGNVTTPGTRIREVVLNDGRMLVQNGAVVTGARRVAIATINFLADGGDQYPFRAAPFFSAPVTYQQALVNYIQQGLDGTITAARYPAGGEGRIMRLPELAIATDSNPAVLGEVNDVTVFNGGFGSAMAPVPGTPGEFYLLTDRGPNVAGPEADTIVFPFPNFTPQIGRFRVDGTTLQRGAVVMLRNAAGERLTGLPNPPGQGGTGETPLSPDLTPLDPDPEGVDSEGLVALADGTFWVSDEYGPHILHLDANGNTIERINPFGTGTGGRTLPAVLAQRRPNRGMEGLTITPDGTTLVGLMQSPLDNPSREIRDTSRIARIVTFEIATSTTQQFVYLLEEPDLVNSAIVALSNTTFLVLERDGNFPGDPEEPSTLKRVFRINISQATNVNDPANGPNGLLVNGQTLEQLCLTTTCEEGLAAAGIVPVSKTLVVDLLALPTLYTHDKPEGLAVVDERTLAVVNDDDFGVTDDDGRLIAKILPLTGAVDRNEIWFVTLQNSFMPGPQVQVTGVVDDGTTASPIANATCQFVNLGHAVLATTRANATGVYTLTVDPGTQGSVECWPRGQRNLRLRGFVSTVGMAGGATLSGQDVSPATTVISDILQTTHANNPAADLVALEAALLADLAAGEANLAVLADAATVLFNAMRAAGINVDFALALNDLLADGTVNLGALQPIAAQVEQAVRAAEEARGAEVDTAFVAEFPPFFLTVLHNNDGESQLVNAGSGLEDFGGIARFATVVRQLRTAAIAAGSGVVLLSSGDNYLAGPEFNASLQRGVPFFDAVALDRIGYDALAIGNHEFDFGPDVLADFIDSFTISTPFLSANLDVSGEPRLQELADAGRIARSTVLTVRGRRIGIVGATTPMLPFISSPRNVVVNPDVVGAVQAEIDRLAARGIDILILISHLQSIEEDLALAPQLRNLDIMIAGGGDELLANNDTLLVPGDEAVVFGPYPLEATDADGNMLPIITTSGAYRYVGRLMVEFNAAGRLVRTDTTSGPVRVAGGDNPDAVEPDPVVQEEVVDPVVDAIAALDATVIGMSEVALDGQRSAVRTRETNLGNLIADALLAQAQALADDFGAPQPDVALQNGGGIRNDTIIAAGDLTELDTFDILPFGNFVALVPNIPAAQFKEILENAVSRVESTDGRFAQVAGFRFTWDPNGTAQLLDDSGNVTTAGTRVREVVLDDGRTLVQNGIVVDGAPDVNVATIDFSARGGDQYPFRGAAFFTLGVSCQQALANFIMTTLEGLVTATAYPEGGEGRIVTLTPVQVTGSVDDGRPTSPIAEAACQFVDLEGTVLATTTADADGLFTLEVPPNTQGFVECTPPTLPNLVLRTFVSTMGLVGGVLSDQDVSPATAVISDLLQAFLASDPTVDLEATEAELLAELDAEEANLSVLADAAIALFNAMRDANLDTIPFAVALEDLLVDGEVDSAALAAIAPTVQEAVDAAEEAHGTQVAAAFAARIPAQRIRHIQGATHRSLREGQTVSVPGIVTALASRGFYLQDPTPDSDAATSEGIFVFTSAAPAVAVGDAVMVRGVVEEFRPGGSGGTGNLTTTELTAPSITVLSSGNPLPTATVIGVGGRIPPQTIIEDDVDGDAELTGTFDPATDGLDFYESLEGMLVQVNDAVAVSPTNDFGEIAVVSDNGANAGLRTPRGGIVIQPGDFNPERIILDDALVSEVPEVNVGDRFAAPVVGVLDYSFGNFKLLNTAPLPAVTPGDLAEEVTALTDSPNQLRVATFNVENLDNNPNDDDTADEDAARFARLAAIIVDHLGAPDIIAMQEVQDNSGSIDNDVVDASRTYEALITAIEQADGPMYDFRDIAPQDNQDGGQPGGNIRVGFLFNPQRVTFVDRGAATATTATAVVEGPSGPELTLSPGRIDPASAAFTDSRKPLAAEFLFERQRLFLINNHFTSKGGSDPLFGRFHPPINGGVEQRQMQAQVVRDFVAEVLAIDAAARVIVLGDLNEFQFLTPLQILAGGPDAILTNLTETLPDEERYTFIFDGNAQSLDHLLVSNSLSTLAEVDIVHVNAEFAARVSDHDPSVARFTFPVRFATFNASLNRASAGQLITDLSTPNNAQARVIAEIIQRANPDVVLINEFDFDPAGTAARLFADNYLAVSQNGAAPVRYPFHYVAPSNTGLACPPTVVCDFDHDGVADTTPGDATYANDALGFGFFPGQFGMIVYTKFPIAEADVRTFQNFLWQDMPGALLPDDPATPAPDDWYTPDELSVFPLSSKSHWDVPVLINGRPVHVLVSHPTPPVFDGAEDRNGRRNHDEIRLWADYINGGARAAYLGDDNGTSGGLTAGDSFVIMGDQNADPFDGDSVDDAILQLLNDPLINAEIDNGFTPISAGAEEQAALQGGANTTHTGNPAFDTAAFADNAPGNLRVDYVLPSADLSIVGSAVFWPVSTDPLFDLVGTFPFPSSDHRLVWVDVVVPR